MSKFDLYARYYDLLYHDKDYESEVEYIDGLIKLFSDASLSSILDIGCGTGKHAHLLSKLGYKVDGVDMAPNMIKLAKSNYNSNVSLQFFDGNATSFRNGKTYGVVTSLFHVISYQNSNENLIDSFTTAHTHLEKNGLFIFDFWYGPGVLTDRPQKRTKLLENDAIRVERKAIPVLHVNENIVDVNYEIEIFDKSNSAIQNIHEKHSMRYLFYPELINLLQSTGFEIVEFYHWMSRDTPDSNTWNGVIIAKRK
jgi:SAM-dependent methyltransferase